MNLGCQDGRVSVVTEPSGLPVSVNAAKTHLRIEHSAEDGTLRDLIQSAADELGSPKGWLGRSLKTQTLRLTLDAYPPAKVYLPGPPVTKVNTIEVRGSDDAFTTVYDADGAIDTLTLQSDLTAAPAWIWPSDTVGWPSDIKNDIDAVRIEYHAGYAADALPKVIRQWLLMRVAELYRDREPSVLAVASTELPHAKRMLDNLRVMA